MNTLTLKRELLFYQHVRNKYLKNSSFLLGNMDTLSKSYLVIKWKERELILLKRLREWNNVS